MATANFSPYINSLTSLSTNFFILPKTVFSTSLQFSPSVESDSLRPHGLQHARPPCPLLTPGAYSKFMSIESVMPSSHLILCCPLLLTPSIFPSIRVFSNESVLHIKWAKYWHQSLQRIFPLGWTGWISLQSKGLSRVFPNTTVQKHQFFGAQLSS